MQPGLLQGGQSPREPRTAKGPIHVSRVLEAGWPLPLVVDTRARLERQYVRGPERRPSY